MERRLLSLKLLLKELGIDPNIRTVDQRKTLQKAVYLAQRAGLDLGHRYGWYLKGPYSPSLARDYYALAEAIEEGNDTSEKYQLHVNQRVKLAGVKEELSQTEGLTRLSKPDWLELLASVDYRIKVVGEGEAAAEATIKTEKPSLAPHFSEALEALARMHLAS